MKINYIPKRLSKLEPYVDYDLINGIHYYKLTSIGKTLIKQEYKMALEFLRQEHPSEVDSISSLFNSFNFPNSTSDISVMKANIDFLVSLLVIGKGKSLRDSYSLAKVLAWKFGIIEFVELTCRLVKEELIKVEIIKRMELYELTSNGKLYLEKHLEEAKPIILEKYINEREFISSLF